MSLLNEYLLGFLGIALVLGVGFLILTSQSTQIGQYCLDNPNAFVDGGDLTINCSSEVNKLEVMGELI